jgi:hypothetical protein
VPLGEALIVVGIDMTSAQSLRADLAPITIGRMALPEHMDVPRRTRWIRLPVQDLILTNETKVDPCEAARVRIGVDPVSILWLSGAQREHRGARRRNDETEYGKKQAETPKGETPGEYGHDATSTCAGP